MSSLLNFESWLSFHLFNHVNVPWSDWCCCWFCRNKKSVLVFVINRLCLTEMCHNTTFIFWIPKLYKFCQSYWPLSFAVQSCYFAGRYQTQAESTLVYPRPHIPSHFVTSDSDIVLLWLGFTETSSWGVNKNNNLSQCHPLIDFSNDFLTELIPDTFLCSNLSLHFNLMMLLSL